MTVIAKEAIKWSCEHCSHIQYSDDSLTGDTFNNDPVRLTAKPAEKKTR
ncbi:MAG: hypothetical protein V3T17_05675 [Pseudomonadales bacterium]